MNKLETFQQEGRLETPGEVGKENPEMVGHTEIMSFENSELTDNKQMAAYLRELPTTHLENCQSIRYEPQDAHLAANGSALLLYDSGTREIKVGSEERFADSNKLTTAIVQGVGCNVYKDIHSKQQGVDEKWEALHARSQTSSLEDFAKTYEMYKHDPMRLQNEDIAKYEFMKENIFFGREFLTPAPQTENARLASMEKIVPAFVDKGMTVLMKVVEEVAEAGISCLVKKITSL
jgi:hypothetical protein